MHPTTTRPHTLRSTLAVLCVTALCVAAGLSTAQDKPAAGPKPALSVAVVTPQTTRLAQTLAANGNLAAWQEASIGAEAGGQRLAEVVNKEVEAYHADRIVLGTHGRRGIGRVLLGSGAEQIIRAAQVPVLVIRGSEEAVTESAQKAELASA